MTRQWRLLAIASAALTLSICGEGSAQPTVGIGGCKPVTERTGEVGCWIIARAPLGPLPLAQVFWYLDSFPTRGDAEAAKGPRGAVVESLGKVWLLTVEAADWRILPGSKRVAAIGPLPITAGETYSAQYMEAIFVPGMTAASHRHSGPEAWYTEAGETCLETPDGTQVGRAGGQYVIVPGGLPMHLTATGTEQRRSIVLILHESSRPPTTPAPDWMPRGLCRR